MYYYLVLVLLVSSMFTHLDGIPCFHARHGRSITVGVWCCEGELLPPLDTVLDSRRCDAKSIVTARNRYCKVCKTAIWRDLIRLRQHTASSQLSSYT
ncbi:hypothetical protein BDP67DRAFT_513753 [Colletotrichum lupini]|nr:hypothetical protein BDP67DRAFT_513753 [Colletotrichum lupini]